MSMAVALLDDRRGLNMFGKADTPVFGIVEKMSYFLCPHCGGRSEIFSHGGARRRPNGSAPLDLKIRETLRSRNPDHRFRTR
jgi:ATP-binding protein involved in chromosome partitioning